MSSDSPLPPLRGEMSQSDRGGAAGDDQIGPTGREPPSAFGISPARGEKGSYASVSPRGSYRRLRGPSPAPPNTPIQSLTRLPTRIRILHTQLPLRVQNQKPINLLPLPQRLHILNHSDNLRTRQLILKRRHIAAKAKPQPALTNDPVQHSIRVMPGMSLTVQRRRRQAAVIISHPPVIDTLTLRAVTHRACRRENLLARAIPSVRRHIRRYLLRFRRACGTSHRQSSGDAQAQNDNDSQC